MPDQRPAIAYLRQSLGRSDENRDTSLSLEQQAESIREWAERNGYRVERYIRDFDVTGRTLNRPGLTELRELVQPGMTVICWKYDRLARSVGGHAILVDELQDRGASVISVTEPQGKLPRQMMAVISEFYSDALSERISAIREAEARRGKFTGGQPPYGYHRANAEEAINKKGQHYIRRSGPVVINPEEAEIVREIFERYLAGESGFAITNDLHRRRVPRSLGGQWEIQMVQRMLANPFYAGHATLKGEIVTEGLHEPIIDESTWQAVQERLARVAVVRHKSTNDAASWLEGLVTHSCQARMHLTVIQGKRDKAGVRRGLYPNFVCARSSGVNRCGEPQIVISQPRLEALVRARLAQDFAGAVSIREALDLAAAKAGGDSVDRARKSLEQQRRALDRRHERARELWLEGGDSLEQWRTEKQRYDAAIERIDREAASLPVAPDPDQYREAAHQLTSLATIIELASGDALRTVLERIGLVIVSKDAVRIDYRAPFCDFIGVP